MKPEHKVLLAYFAVLLNTEIKKIGCSFLTVCTFANNITVSLLTEIQVILFCELLHVQITNRIFMTIYEILCFSKGKKMLF